MVGGGGFGRGTEEKFNTDGLACTMLCVRMHAGLGRRTTNETVRWFIQ